MKKVVKSSTLKRILPILILAVTASFMFFIVEPITLYGTNIHDFWFDLYRMMPILFPTFLLVALGASALLIGLYFLFLKFFKKVELYYYFLGILFLGFLITYIQGNFLAGNLPGLNGDVFKWREFPVETTISVLLWIIVFIAALIIVKKIKIEKFIKYISYITLGVFGMLAVSLLSVLLTTRALEKKDLSKATFDYYNEASTDRNFFVFLVDAIDSRSFDELLKNNSDYKETLKDFSYYQDTTSYYPYTRDSIPYIFYQEPNENKTPFDEYSIKAFNESKILNDLRDDGYKMAIYDDQLIMSRESAETFRNMSTAVKINHKNFIEEIIRYDLYKYLPYPLKGKVHIENLNFWSSDLEEGHKEFVWQDRTNYDIYQNEEIEKVSDKVFHFIHLEGGHIWFNLDENLNPVDKTVGTYSQKQMATFKVIKAYLDRLKEAGVYDNSSIVILADHGYKDGVWEYDYILNRFNPILYIKGAKETHSEMNRSEKPISFADFREAFEDLRLGKASTELFTNIEPGRTRKIIYYVWNHEDHMVEYEVTGKAWENEKMIETGRAFDL